MRLFADVQSVQPGMRHPRPSSKPIFEEPPEALDETWAHGALVGGLGWATSSEEIVRSYLVAAELLVEKGIAAQTPSTVAYPVLFLYRHAIEVCLKSLLAATSHTHSLPHLIEQVDGIARRTMTATDADWLRNRLTEFVRVDPQSTAFRFENARVAGEPRSDGEWWIDFPHLHHTMATVFQLLQAIRLGDTLPDPKNRPR